MALRTDWENWKGLETLHSGKKSVCITGNTPGKNCWKKVLREDNICFFSVCLDCLVYLCQQKTASLSKEEIHDILQERNGTPRRSRSYPPSNSPSREMVAGQL